MWRGTSRAVRSESCRSRLSRDSGACSSRFTRHHPAPWCLPRCCRERIDVSSPMVKAEAVNKSFGRLEVLRGIDLEVQPKEVMCMIGPSGSGKSTFLRCINHLEKIDSGRLSVDGELVGYREKGDKLYELPDR